MTGFFNLSPPIFTEKSAGVFMTDIGNMILPKGLYDSDGVGRGGEGRVPKGRLQVPIVR